MAQTCETSAAFEIKFTSREVSAWGGLALMKRMLDSMNFRSGIAMGFPPAHERVQASVYRWFFDTVSTLPSITLDMDSTVIRHGQQQGAARGYNPNKRRRLSHHPLLAFVAEARMVANVLAMHTPPTTCCNSSKPPCIIWAAKPSDSCVPTAAFTIRPSCNCSKASASITSLTPASPKLATGHHPRCPLVCPGDRAGTGIDHLSGTRLEPGKAHRAGTPIDQTQDGTG